LQFLLYDSKKKQTNKDKKQNKTKSKIEEQGTFPINMYTTSFPGSLSIGSLRHWQKDPGCKWSRDPQESGWQTNLLGGRAGSVLIVAVTNFVSLKSNFAISSK